MPVYNGNSKAKDLYYGGTKIKEAYYGNTKVYSGVKPSYYCYNYNGIDYRYFPIKPVSAGNYTCSMNLQYMYGVKVNNPSEFNYTFTATISSATESTIVFSGGSTAYTYSPNDDLYT